MTRKKKRILFFAALLLLSLFVTWCMIGILSGTTIFRTTPMDAPLEVHPLCLDQIDTALRSRIKLSDKLLLTEAAMEARVENGEIHAERMELRYCRFIFTSGDDSYIRTETYRIDMADGVVTELLRQNGSSRGIAISTEPIAEQTKKLLLTDYIGRALQLAALPLETAIFVRCDVTAQGMRVTLYDGDVEDNVLFRQLFDPMGY